MGKLQETPAAIATWPLEAAVEAAGKVLINRGSALDSVEKGINLVELDPNDQSVGYGGLPNADGVVELDAAIMDGKTHNAGSVAALKQIKHPISVARRIMEVSPHAMLVGEGALAFAASQGFPTENLLTEAAQAKWKEWREGQKTGRYEGSHDTIGLVAMDGNGDIAAGCSTSGLKYKHPVNSLEQKWPVRGCIYVGELSLRRLDAIVLRSEICET